ncbi:MAG: cobalt ECF transporter T component CbiQ [Rhodospirillales bacterium]|nr:cobalt ECF transporter T component CbiQ [Rhodospirillales bacterium]
MSSVVKAVGVAGVFKDIDPRVRIITASLLAIVVVSLSSFLALGSALAGAFVVFTITFAQGGMGAALKKVLAMDAFIFLVLIILPFSTPGTPLFSIGEWVASEEGLFKAIAIAMKANIAVMLLLSQVGTIEPVTMGHALHRLKVPAKLIHLLLFTLRYLNVLHEEYSRMRTAMKIRGFRPGTNLHTYKSFGYLLGMMLVRSLERSERIYGAMKCRGFRGQFFLFDEEKIDLNDMVYGSAALFALGAIIALEVGYVSYV